jgi:hypothetical protein
MRAYDAQFEQYFADPDHVKALQEMLDYIEELQAALNAVASTYGMTGEEYAKVRVTT